MVSVRLLVVGVLLTSALLAAGRPRMVNVVVVNGEGRAALAGATVRLMPMDTVLVADENGKCAIAGILPDTVRAIATAKGFLADTGMTAFRFGDTSDIILDPYSDMPRATAGEVKDERTQDPLAGVVVTLLRGTSWDTLSLLGRDPKLVVLAVDTTDDLGRYFIEVPPGTQTIDYVKPGYHYAATELTVWGSRTPKSSFATLYDTGYACLTGTIGSTDAARTVDVFDVSDNGGRLLTLTRLGNRYRLSGLEPGAHTITGFSMGFAEQKKKVVLKPGTTTRLDFELKPTAGGDY